MTNNVINFPKPSRDRPPQNQEEFRRSILDSKAEYANEIVDHYAQQLANKIGMHGFQIDNEQFMKDFAFTVESMRSCLQRSLGVHHPFQEMIDTAIADIESFDLDDGEPDPEDDLI